ncbi:MAG: YlbF family regulator [Thermoleophilia bacterium]|nr:YlbF family regulator [Thermoleophilia bacterium]
MSIVLSKAEELAAAISECEELGVLREAAQKVDSDEAASAALQKFSEKQEMVQRAASSGLQLPPEQMEELQEMQGQIREIPSIKDFATAQGSFNVLMDQVNEIISAAVMGREPGEVSDCGCAPGTDNSGECAPGDGGNGGSCGCGH